jgi:hypothetical protein
MQIPTYNPSIVDEWKHRCDQFEQKSRWLWRVLIGAVVIAPVPPIIGVVPWFPYAIAIPFAMVAAALLLRSLHLVRIKCPNCGKPPIGQFNLMPLYVVDCCPHCYHWLVNPRSGRAGA